MKEFYKEYGFTAHERVTLSSAYERIAENKTARDKLLIILRGYDSDVDSVTGDTLNELKVISDVTGVHLYTVELLTLICLFRKLRERLLTSGISKKNVSLTILDLTIKMRECEVLHGVVGTEHWIWYTRFLALRIFAFGRLQIEATLFSGGMFKKGEFCIKRGEVCFSVHIPRTGTPLTERSVISSLREARDFYCPILESDNVCFVCSSWLLYPKNHELLPMKSNIVKFMKLFDIVESHDYTDDSHNPAMDFIFQKKPGTPIDQLPRDTSLRAAYAKHLEEGGRLGYGFGILFFKREQGAVES